ncbi:MAG: GNAT family N-acetyltransferase [Rhodocyclaceae bacterium]|jgi:acetyltransferase|nr:GNAT family N-acetyltransferase [Rhodocyclaceae bacterium]MCA3019255.1 GNAT family N-acetyltransferase [Rhodocyclaceae bacterium]MCA3023194.1 GNAT family N-acetyltransferase [Rhodocyclaceae bacterium]MCA3025966.1 GNAT family N-acetyltransferase [Rhodocyclaceae bacterium]MCA3029225.1 GNAT family N-acetyltransferase [Rhodocyclaceae bacterium]
MTAVETLSSFDDNDRMALAGLLRDAVENGASVGYVMPIDEADISAFWAGVFEDVVEGSRALLIVRQSGQIVGSVQIEFAGKPNGRHRAEIQKMLVHSSQRRKGLGRQLMMAVEACAKSRDRSLLVLDTETASAGQHLYASMGFIAAGEIPKFALGTNGGWSPTTYMYKLL